MKKAILAAVSIMSGTLLADTTPVMVSLVTPVQAPNASFDVCGLRLSFIYGDCGEFTGLDIGIANRARGDFYGLGVGGVNIAGGNVYGAQFGLVNWIDDDNRNAAVDKRSCGLQWGLLNQADAFCGVQDGFVNVATESFSGLQTSLVNYANNLRGVQCGAYFIFGVNIANGPVHGCQVGLVNYAEEMARGLQIGLVNIIGRNGWAPVLPFVNGHF